MTHLENELDITIEKLTTTNTKLDEKEKAYAVAESEIQAQNRKLFLEQDELEVWKEIWKLNFGFSNPANYLL